MTAVPDVIHHLAIEDDWGMSRGFGEYEVATRGTHIDDVGYIHATTADRVEEVIQTRYADLTLPLLDIEIDVAALAAEGVEVNWVEGRPRIMGVLPMLPGVILSETLVRR